MASTQPGVVLGDTKADNSLSHCLGAFVWGLWEAGMTEFAASQNKLVAVCGAMNQVHGERGSCFF
jgi:hypothetical protein